ncbi:MAG: glycosyltransferase family 4 protein [Candidatus Paceibacterota bacterium]|jgi:glycosyltransferase involved in cell wall biosynthesis
MKILIATGIYPPDIGGPATYSKLLNDELPKRGIEVLILSFGEVRHLPKVIRHIVFFFKLIKRSRGCDIIFAQDPVSVGLPSLFVSKILGKKFFIRVAGDYAWEQSMQRFGISDTIDDFQNKKYKTNVEFLRSIQKFVVGHADTVITPSIYFRDLVSRWNKKQKRVFHIYNGIEFPTLDESKDVAREKVSISNNVISIVSSGRLVPWKGFFTLIDVIGNLVKDIPNCKLYIIGDGPDRPALERYIVDKGLESIVILTGSISRSEMFSYLIASDIFVLNTSFESFSFQIVEAMYAGIPVVSTNIGNIPEIIEDGNSGILVKPDDREALKISILKILDDSDFREKIRMIAKQKSKQFSIDNTLDQLCKLFLMDIKNNSHHTCSGKC